MGKKRKNVPSLDEILERPFCYYCERDFDDNRILIAHQKAKHYKCDKCNRRLNTAGGLQVHMQQVHKEQLTKIENAIEGREDVNIEIFGMVGIPEDLMAAHRQQVTTAYYQQVAERRAETGNPAPGTQPAEGESASKRVKVEETKEGIAARLAEQRRKNAEKREMQHLAEKVRLILSSFVKHGNPTPAEGGHLDGNASDDSGAAGRPQLQPEEPDWVAITRALKRHGVLDALLKQYAYLLLEARHPQSRASGGLPGFLPSGAADPMPAGLSLRPVSSSEAVLFLGPPLTQLQKPFNQTPLPQGLGFPTTLSQPGMPPTPTSSQGFPQQPQYPQQGFASPQNSMPYSPPATMPMGPYSNAAVPLPGPGARPHPRARSPIRGTPFAFPMPSADQIQQNRATPSNGPPLVPSRAPAASGLPTRPNFNSPNISRGDMQRMHGGHPPPPGATPSYPTQQVHRRLPNLDGPKDDNDSVQQLIQSVRNELSEQDRAAQHQANVNNSATPVNAVDTGRPAPVAEPHPSTDKAPDATTSTNATPTPGTAASAGVKQAASPSTPAATKKEKKGKKSRVLQKLLWPNNEMSPEEKKAQSRKYRFNPGDQTHFTMGAPDGAVSGVAMDQDTVLDSMGDH